MFLYFCIPIDGLNYSLTVVPLGTIGGPEERLVLKWLSLCQVTRPKNRTLKFKKNCQLGFGTCNLASCQIFEVPMHRSGGQNKK